MRRVPRWAASSSLDCADEADMIRASKTDLEQFEAACRMLAALTSKGFEIYVAGSGTVCLMAGPSHDADGRPQRANIIDSHSVPGAGGGDW